MKVKVKKVAVKKVAVKRKKNSYFSIILLIKILDLKYLVFGLGNIGAKYANTRHNIGFKVLDALAEVSNLVFIPNRYAHICDYKFKGRLFKLIKPSTYMNLSGKAVNYWMQKEKTSIDKVFIIVDDIALPFGTIRIKSKGSDAGHNGLSNIQETIGHNKYSRMRFGIGNEFPKGNQADYVLSQWDTAELSILNERTDKMIEAIKSFGTVGIDRTMNLFNGK